MKDLVKVPTNATEGSRMNQTIGQTQLGGLGSISVKNSDIVNYNLYIFIFSIYLLYRYIVIFLFCNNFQ